MPPIRRVRGAEVVPRRDARVAFAHHRDHVGAQRGEYVLQAFRADEDVDVDIVGRARDPVLAVSKRTAEGVRHRVPLEHLRDLDARLEGVARRRHTRRRAAARSRRSSATESAGRGSR
jgi:hypothetical protein